MIIFLRTQILQLFNYILILTIPQKIHLVLKKFVGLIIACQYQLWPVKIGNHDVTDMFHKFVPVER